MDSHAPGVEVPVRSPIKPKTHAYRIQSMHSLFLPIAALQSVSHPRAGPAVALAL
jgi:hypothetical protein